MSYLCSLWLFHGVQHTVLCLCFCFVCLRLLYPIHVASFLLFMLIATLICFVYSLTGVRNKMRHKGVAFFRHVAPMFVPT